MRVNSFAETSRTPLSESVVASRFVHPSGLTVLLCVDPASPLAAVQTWYRVGSADELPGKTGIAHLFEHLMFTGTHAFPTGDFDRLIEEVGGDCNAATWVDWTSYSITLPKSELELALRLEADRMVNLALGPDVLEAERDVVLNERLECVDDDIGGFLDEQLGMLAFEVHPYGRPTIGFEEDIRGLDLETIEAFYRSNYAPNNAVVVVSGGIDEEVTLAAVEAQFGHLPAGKPTKRQWRQEPEQNAARSRRFARETRAARLVYGFKIPGQSDPDWPALAALAGLLSGGPSARLTHELVANREVAIYAESEVLPLRDPTLFRIAVGGTLGASVDDLEAAVAAVLEPICSGGAIHDVEVEKVRSSLETDFWIELETDDGKAEALGRFETTHGDYRKLLDIATALRAVTPDDMTRVARKYLAPQRRSLVAAIPGGDE